MLIKWASLYEFRKWSLNEWMEEVYLLFVNLVSISEAFVVFMSYLCPERYVTFINKSLYIFCWLNSLNEDCVLLLVFFIYILLFLYLHFSIPPCFLINIHINSTMKKDFCCAHSLHNVWRSEGVYLSVYLCVYQYVYLSVHSSLHSHMNIV